MCTTLSAGKDRANHAFGEISKNVFWNCNFYKWIDDKWRLPRQEGQIFHFYEVLRCKKTIISCSSNKHTECVSVTNTVLTTSALLRSRVSHIKPWGKEYGSCRIFSLSASIGPWLVTTSSAKIAQLLSKTQLFSIQNTFSGPVNWLFLAFCLGDTDAECVFENIPAKL